MQFWDWEGFVRGYERVIASACTASTFLSEELDLSVTGGSFNLGAWWAAHQLLCPGCESLGSLEHAIGYWRGMDMTARCPIERVLRWLAGRWVIPLRAWPAPRPFQKNHSSFTACPESLAEPLAKLARIIGPPKPGFPIRTYLPMLGIVRRDDLHGALKALERLGANYGPPLHHKRDIGHVDRINRLIRATIAAQPAEAAAAGLAPVDVRPCVDARLINDCTSPWPFHYASVHDAVAMLTRYAWMAKVDLKKAFFQIPVHPATARYFAMRFEAAGVTVDGVSESATFGGRNFPALCNALLSKARLILRSRGVPIVFLTDDIFLCGATEEECAANLKIVIKTMEELGFELNHAKTVRPTQRLTFLGITIDTVACRLSIEPYRLLGIAERVEECLERYSASRRYSIKEWESLLGRLNWVAEVLIAGRPHLGRLWHAFPALKAGYAPDDLTAAALRWWLSVLVKRAEADDLWAPFWTAAVPITDYVFSDASGDIGFGAVFDGWVVQGRWSAATAASTAIGLKELLPVWFAVQHFAQQPEAHGKVLVIGTDNLSNVFAINRGRFRSPEHHALLCDIFGLAARHRIYLVADWVPREHNQLTDDLSKWVRHEGQPEP